VHRRVLTTPALALGFAVLADGQAQPGKVGIIHIQNAIISTQDGQKAASDLQARFDPKRKELEQKQNEIDALRQQLQKGSNTMSDEAKQKLMREIDGKTRSLNRETEDAQTDFDQEQQKLLQELGGRMMEVISKYARDNNYSLILDVSSPQTPVLFAANGIDITKDIVDLYDKRAPSASRAPVPASSGVTRQPVVSPPAKPGAAPKPGTVK